MSTNEYGGIPVSHNPFVPVPMMAVIFYQTRKILNQRPGQIPARRPTIQMMTIQRQVPTTAIVNNSGRSRSREGRLSATSQGHLTMSRIQTGVLYYYDQFGRGWDMGQAGRNLDVGHLEGGQGTCLDFGQSEGSATCSMLLWGTSTKSLYTL